MNLLWGDAFALTNIVSILFTSFLLLWLAELALYPYRLHGIVFVVMTFVFKNVVVMLQLLCCPSVGQNMC